MDAAELKALGEQLETRKLELVKQLKAEAKAGAR
jgi:hypothetical protein